ncbi:hypothetical protein QOT17_022953 [Balamuthia mandrillaris]
MQQAAGKEPTAKWVTRFIVGSVFVGTPLVLHSSVNLYAGYQSAGWPTTTARLTSFRLRKAKERQLKSALWWERIVGFFREDALNLEIEFVYDLPPEEGGSSDVDNVVPRQYKGTSITDPNFPSSLSLQCPACLLQAELLCRQYSTPGTMFPLSYRPLNSKAASTPPFPLSLLPSFLPQAPHQSTTASRGDSSFAASWSHDTTVALHDLNGAELSTWGDLSNAIDRRVALYESNSERLDNDAQTFWQSLKPRIESMFSLPAYVLEPGYVRDQAFSLFGAGLTLLTASVLLISSSKLRKRVGTSPVLLGLPLSVGVAGGYGSTSWLQQKLDERLRLVDRNADDMAAQES